MRLSRLVAYGYRSLRSVDVSFGELNVLIGANAAGKSNIIDALRLLHLAVMEKSFAGPVRQRGGILHLAWKGQAAREVVLELHFEHGTHRIEWKVQFVRDGSDFHVVEEVDEFIPGVGRVHRLYAEDGSGWWNSPDRDRVGLDLRDPTGCALAAAADDKSFPVRSIELFVRRWGFFDPNPWLLRRPSDDPTTLGAYGENLAPRLRSIQDTQPEAYERILGATRSILGVPDSLEFRESESDGRVYFVQREAGLAFGVHQIGASSGTLRMLALMTALHAPEGGDMDAALIGIEEPENYVHPSALAAFADHLARASKDMQILVTTHSPLLLNCIANPEVVRIVRRGPHGDTEVIAEAHPEALRKAVEESGLGLGELLETKGFGA